MWSQVCTGTTARHKPRKRTRYHRKHTPVSPTPAMQRRARTGGEHGRTREKVAGGRSWSVEFDWWSAKAFGLLPQVVAASCKRTGHIGRRRRHQTPQQHEAANPNGVNDQNIAQLRGIPCTRRQLWLSINMPCQRSMRGWKSCRATVR